MKPHDTKPPEPTLAMRYSAAVAALSTYFQMSEKATEQYLRDMALLRHASRRDAA